MTHVAKNIMITGAKSAATAATRLSASTEKAIWSIGDNLSGDKTLSMVEWLIQNGIIPL